MVQEPAGDRVLIYAEGATRLHGHLVARPDGGDPRPGVLVFPEWWGINDYTRQRAAQLADRGYVALVVDMYGDGASTNDAAQAREWASTTRTGPLSRARSAAALEALRAQPGVDPTRVAAIGFCFGGSVALELARSGADVRGVVALHAALRTPAPARRGELTAPVLVLHGADDPLVSAEQLQAFHEEMRAAGADWQLVSYGGAVHSFSNPEADAAGIEGVAYDERAARRGWRATLDFLDEVVTGP